MSIRGRMSIRVERSGEVWSWRGLEGSPYNWAVPLPFFLERRIDFLQERGLTAWRRED